MSDTETSIAEQDRLHPNSNPTEYHSDSYDSAEEINEEQRRASMNIYKIYIIFAFLYSLLIGYIIYIKHENILYIIGQKTSCSNCCCLCFCCILMILLVLGIMYFASKWIFRSKSEDIMSGIDWTFPPTISPELTVEPSIEPSTVGPSFIPSPTIAPAISMNNEYTNWTSCHYDDDIYPIDNGPCGQYQCSLNPHNKAHIGIHNIWDDVSIEYNKNIIKDMLQYMDPILPNIIEYNQLRINDTSQYSYNESNITVLGSRIALEYLCCYNTSEANTIIDLFNNYEWESFDIQFDRFICLNNTHINKTYYVLLLSPESQALMNDWSDAFIEHIINGSNIEWKPESREEGQPFHTTFAIFNEYNRDLETKSVDTINYLNAKYMDYYRQLTFTFSKENTYAYIKQ